MHEFGIVESIVNGVLPELYAANVERVVAVHFRRGSAFSEDALRLAYQAVTQGTPLQNAALVIDIVDFYYHCRCGYHKMITSDDLVGHTFICPYCSTGHEVDQTHNLELVEIIAEMD